MKNSIKGWKEIFRFGFIQSLKTKSIKISTIILCVIALLSMPVISLINDSGEENKESTSVKQVKVADMTGLNLIQGIEVLKSSELYDESMVHLYENIEYTVADIDMKELAQDTKLKDVYKFDKDCEYIYMQIMYAEDSFDIQIINSKNTKISEEDLNDYSDFVRNNFRKVLESMAGLDEDALKILESVNVVNGYDISVIDEDGEKSEESDKEQEVKKEEEEKHSQNAYGIIYALLMIVMFALAFGGERIAMSIITEKSSKVMEYLMTSVKPMAIVVGKILSEMLILFMQLGLIIVSFAVSVLLNSFINPTDEGIMPSFLAQIFNMNNFAGTNPFTVILSILIIIGGFIFFGLIAALAGASVSKIEEMSEGVKLYTIVLIIGAYIGLFAINSNIYEGSSVFKNVVMLVPVTSVFITPGSALTGYFSFVMTFIALIIMIISIVLMTKFVANVYESMIYYNGTPLKLKDIINISKQKGKRQGKE